MIFPALNLNFWGISKPTIKWINMYSLTNSTPIPMLRCFGVPACTTWSRPWPRRQGPSTNTGFASTPGHQMWTCFTIFSGCWFQSL